VLGKCLFLQIREEEKTQAFGADMQLHFFRYRINVLNWGFTA